MLRLTKRQEARRRRDERKRRVARGVPDGELRPHAVEFRYQGQMVAMLTAGINDHITGQIIGKKRFYELDLLERIRALGIKGLYVDVGAHIGNHSVYFARYCPATHVIAVEADPELAKICQDNLQGCRAHCDTTFETVPYACYDGLPVKIVRHKIRNTGMQSVQTDWDGRPSKTLADILGGRVPAVVKIDIEGGEPVVLWDALPLLREHTPLLVIESRTGAEYSDTEDKLRELGYRSEGPYALTPTYIWRAA